MQPILLSKGFFILEGTTQHALNNYTEDNGSKRNETLFYPEFLVKHKDFFFVFSRTNIMALQNTCCTKYLPQFYFRKGPPRTNFHFGRSAIRPKLRRRGGGLDSGGGRRPPAGFTACRTAEISLKKCIFCSEYFESLICVACGTLGF